jgi:hypothetical protein
MGFAAGLLWNHTRIHFTGPESKSVSEKQAAGVTRGTGTGDRGSGFRGSGEQKTISLFQLIIAFYMETIYFDIG